MRLGSVNRICRVVWIQERETSVDWKTLLTALIDLNRGSRCKEWRVVKLPARGENFNNWTYESNKRTPNFVCCMDILALSNFLNDDEKEIINHICEARNISLCGDLFKYRDSNPFLKEFDPRNRSNYKHVRSDNVIFNRMINYAIITEHSNPFLKLFDPHYQPGYENDWTDYEKFEAMIRYTQITVHQMHNFLGSDDMFNPNRLPWSLADGITQPTGKSVMRLYCRDCPKRLSFIMHFSFLLFVQETLLLRLPSWYGMAFLIKEELEFISRHFHRSLHATNRDLVETLRDRCYPSKEIQDLLGPLLNQLSIYAPFFLMVPMDESQPDLLPDILEDLTAELTEMVGSASYYNSINYSDWDSDSEYDSYNSSDFDSYLSSEYDSDSDYAILH